MPFKNIDTSSLTPEQLASAELMQEYAQSPECRANFGVVSTAEKLLGHLIQSEHRLAPVQAFELALKYAEHAHSSGEQFMQAAFERWRDARPVEAAPAAEDVSDVDDADPVVTVADLPIDSAETITRDDAIVDTERRVAAAADDSYPPPTQGYGKPFDEQAAAKYNATQEEADHERGLEAIV